MARDSAAEGAAQRAAVSGDLYGASRIVRSRAAMWSARTAWRCLSGVLRKCPVLDYKFIALGHNTVRGAAGAAVLNAELMKAEGWLERLA